MTVSNDEMREPVRNFTFPRHTIVSLLVFCVFWEVLSYLAPTLGIPPFAIPSLAKIAKSIATITWIDIAVTLMEAAKQQRRPWRPVRILSIDRLLVGGLGLGKVPLLGIVGGQAQGRLGGDLPAARGGRLLEEPDLVGVLLTGKQ